MKKTLQTSRHQHGDIPAVWITRLPQEDLWITQSDYLIHIHWTENDGSDQSGEILIPLGYRFDLASIPRIFWRIIAPFELSLVAPLVHDFLYEWTGCMNPRILPDGGYQCEKILSRKQTDEIFLRLMDREGISGWRRKIAHRAVRIASSGPWKRRASGIGNRNR